MAQVVEFLLPTWETWREFLAPGFRLAQPDEWKNLGSEPEEWEPLPHPLPLSLTLLLLSLPASFK